MLFNSPIFIFIFLPLVLAGFYGTSRVFGREVAIVWLVLASLFFYGWWNPVYLLLMMASILANFSFGYLLPRTDVGFSKRAILVAGILFNLGLLGYFKYANFFVDSLNAAAGTGIELAPIMLPLAISFFTFQQVAYLVDAYQDKTQEYNFSHYCLFVVFFPQLIAGPIVHHKEILPQFLSSSWKPRLTDIAIGSTIFILGLAKKVLVADTLAIYANPVFLLADTGADVSFIQAWVGALAYSFQLYFDFSGYTDMAIGLARMFGITLPLNFNSPYKATSIIDFWRRWHMTLSRFLRDYVYIPLGGSRKGSSQRYINLMLTMLIGGLWHGAGWTFVLWGALHGVYLVVNHGWRNVYALLGYPLGRDRIVWRYLSGLLTFIAVVIAWVVFRASSIEGVATMLRAMSGMDGVALPVSWMSALGPASGALSSLGVATDATFKVAGGLMAVAAIAVAAAIVFLLPNVQQVMCRTLPVLGSGMAVLRPVKDWMCWKPSLGWAVYIGLTAAITLGFLARVSEFLYFQF